MTGKSASEHHAVDPDSLELAPGTKHEILEGWIPDLASEAEISSRHLSFIETGRAAPSRAMVLRLAEYLDVPLRERNELLNAAGFAPVFQERSYQDCGLYR